MIKERTSGHLRPPGGRQPAGSPSSGGAVPGPVGALVTLADRCSRRAPTSATVVPIVLRGDVDGVVGKGSFQAARAIIVSQNCHRLNAVSV